MAIIKQFLARQVMMLTKLIKQFLTILRMKVNSACFYTLQTAKFCEGGTFPLKFKLTAYIVQLIS